MEPAALLAIIEGLTDFAGRLLNLYVQIKGTMATVRTAEEAARLSAVRQANAALVTRLDAQLAAIAAGKDPP